MGENSMEKQYVDQPSSSTTIPIPLVVSFLQRFKSIKRDKEFENFVKLFKQLYINILFTDPILQIPSNAKFLKEITSRKRKLEDCETITLTKECSAIIQNKLLPKPKDPRGFSYHALLVTLNFLKVCVISVQVFS